jgi:Tol biopolymer transport system component
MAGAARLLTVLVGLTLATAIGATSSQTASAAFVGENGRIAYSQGLRTIYSVTPNGSALRRVTDRDFNTSPSFSPDGRRIVYRGVRGLMIMNSDGRSKHALGPELDAVFPAWSPDGDTIAFGQLTDVDELWLIGDDGGSLRYLTGGTDPVWAPNGSTIAYTAKPDRCDGVYSIGVDGRSNRTLVRPRQQGEGCPRQARHPDLSPHGRFLAYTRVLRTSTGGRSQFSNDIVILDLKTHRHRMLTRSGRASQPAWAPDGHRLAYVQPDGLWVIGSNGRAARRIAKGGSDPSLTGITGPSWQPR